MRLEISKTGNPEAEEAKEAGIEIDESNTRKHLPKTLRSSIEAQGQADAKRRKCRKAKQSPTNSREGEDQKVLNWDHTVENVEDDLQQTDFH